MYYIYAPIEGSSSKPTALVTSLLLPILPLK